MSLVKKKKNKNEKNGSSFRRENVRLNDKKKKSGKTYLLFIYLFIFPSAASTEYVNNVKTREINSYIDVNMVLV